MTLCGPEAGGSTVGRVFLTPRQEMYHDTTWLLTPR